MTAIVSLYESFALELVGGNVAGVVLCDALPDVGTLLAGTERRGPCALPRARHPGSGGLRLDAPSVAELATRCGVDTICVWAPGRGEDVYTRDLCARVGDPDPRATWVWRLAPRSS